MAATEAHRLEKFAEMLEEDEPNREQIFAMTAAKLGSGVRARWIELPDCNNEGPLEAGEVELKYDLSNAIIATCKSYGISTDRYGKLTQGEPTATAIEEAARATEKGIWLGLGRDAHSKHAIYDPVIHEEGAGWSNYSVGGGMSVDNLVGGRIPSHEH